MNRTQLQALAEERVLDARVLLDAGQWSGAYYLAGYAVECGLKACIAKLTNLHDFPDKEFAVKCFTHRIENLVDIAGLKQQRDADSTLNEELGKNWLVAGAWNEKARYEHTTEPKARKLFAAVSDPTNGVLSWIKAHW